MALLVADRVKETTSFSGTTSPITLLGAATGYQSFAVIGNGNTTYYTNSAGTQPSSLSLKEFKWPPHTQPT